MEQNKTREQNKNVINETKNNDINVRNGINIGDINVGSATGEIVKLGNLLVSNIAGGIKTIHYERRTVKLPDIIYKINKKLPEDYEVKSMTEKSTLIGKKQDLTENQIKFINDCVRDVVAEKINDYEKEKNIVKNAYDKIENKNDIIGISKDWYKRFWNSVKYVTDEEVLGVFENILANESTNKGIYSIRTLEFLKSATKEDLILLKEFWKVSFLGLNGVRYFIKSDNILPNSKFYSIDNIFELMNIGLINSSNDTRITIENGTLKHGNIDYCFLGEKVTIPVLIFTKLGNEICSLFDSDKTYQYTQISDDKAIKLFKLHYGQTVKVYINDADSADSKKIQMRTIRKEKPEKK